MPKPKKHLTRKKTKARGKADIVPFLLKQKLGNLSNKQKQATLKNIFSNLPKPNIELSKQCPICNEQLIEGVNVLRCGHRFHNECIENAIHAGYNNCPLCRTPIVEPDEEDELTIPIMDYNQALEARAQATAARRRAYDEYIEARVNELDYREMYGADNSETYNTLLTNYERASNSYNLARARLDEIMRIINQLS